MGALAASIASHVPPGVLASLAALPNPGELVRRAVRLEDELRELLLLNGRAGAAEERAGNGAQQTRERFLRAYERLKSELLDDRTFNFDFTDETRQWVAKVRTHAACDLAASSLTRMITSDQLMIDGHARSIYWISDKYGIVRTVLSPFSENFIRPFRCFWRLPLVRNQRGRE
jgi:farnesyl diphosphate synthase